MFDGIKNKYISFIKNFYDRRKEMLVRKGINTSRKAFTGPKVVEIDLSSKCINSCIACWIHSPLLEKKYLNENYLDYNLFKKQVKELLKLKVEKIQIAGAGEPFLNPNAYNIIKDLKDMGFHVSIITSLYPVKKNLAEFLVENRVDNLTVSLWAGTKETWHKMHPGINGHPFDDICIFLETLKNIKLKYKSEKPRVKFFNVITSLNYDSLQDMLDFAIKYNGDEIEFQTVDIIKGKTDFLDLNEIQAGKVLEQFKEMRGRKDYTAQFIGLDNELNLDTFDAANEQKEFGRFFHTLKNDFEVVKNGKILCPQKYLNIRQSWVNNHPYPKLSYEWDNRICKTCNYSNDCYPFSDSVPIECNFLNLVGAGSFLRRIFSKAGNYPADINITDKLPCFVGWSYLRILSNGDIIPCCKASKIVLGSIKNNRLSTIWYSDEYNEFREKTIKLKKSDYYFQNINCIKGCDNIGLNIEVKKML